jgi:hypothetical protein
MECDARTASHVRSPLSRAQRSVDSFAGAPPCVSHCACKRNVVPAAASMLAETPPPPRVSFFAPPKKETKERRGPNRVGLRPIPEFGQRQAGSAEGATALASAVSFRRRQACLPNPRLHLALFSDTPAAHPKNRGSDNCASSSALHCANSARLQGKEKAPPLPHPNPPLRTGEGTARHSGACGRSTPGRIANPLNGAMQPRCARRHYVRTVAIAGTATAGARSESSPSGTAGTDPVTRAGKSEAPRLPDTLPPIPSPETRGGLGWGSGLACRRPSEAPHSARSQPIKKRNCPSSGFRVARSVARKRASFALPVGCVLNAGTLHSRALSGPRLSLVPFFGGAKKGTLAEGGAPRRGAGAKRPANASTASAARGNET